ncbi:MAG: hypothetical protein A2219_01090 [Elusimicrobia bacterium RIFOXYA2_FULL_50_26]|nr:MAG: hypothetical protein A2219_01090 [Elusimicrobia bacterium RIFOXYA2_FULL_50_26]OGS23408.1 MAG: hypothetical protein A2314_00620 [Elusimicrobia bacterium RIFOXYB2_FULL_50_12]
MNRCTKGSKVKVAYVGTLSDGTVFDSSEDGNPLEFVMGDGKLIADFEGAVDGMSEGEKKTVSVPADRAYGNRDESLIRSFPRNLLPSDGRLPAQGMALNLYLPNGKSIPGVIVAVNEQDVMVDLNHPLAGQNLTFEITLISIC